MKVYYDFGAWSLDIKQYDAQIGSEEHGYFVAKLDEEIIGWWDERHQPEAPAHGIIIVNGESNDS